jgi:hypothetical protein
LIPQRDTRRRDGTDDSTITPRGGYSLSDGRGVVAGEVVRRYEI